MYSVVGALIILVITLDFIQPDGRGRQCAIHHRCVPFSDCRDGSEIVYPCSENATEVCCAPKDVIQSVNDSSQVTSRISVFPTDCGVISGTDRITGGELAAVGQFPWMALLGYTQRGINIHQFLCGGSLITKDYVLTAAHCLSIASTLTLEVVRLGEHNLETAEDCDGTLCTEHADIPVDKVTVNENYNKETLENDIAVVKLKGSIDFTEFIRPICLPFKGSEIDYTPVPNLKLIVSGWGKTDSANIGGSTNLLYTTVTVWEAAKCNASVPPRIRPIKPSQLCANGERKRDACKGDSGGPLANSTFVNGEFRTYQVGIVSFASALICGNAELPTIYTRVEYFMDWIVSNVL